MVNASTKIRAMQAMFVKRSIHSRNNLDRGLSWLSYRSSLLFSDIHSNFFALPIRDLRFLLSIA